MRKTRNRILRLSALAGVIALGAVATAMPMRDAQIAIDRALNSPTLNISYRGAKAALVELRINGQSIGTRAVNAGQSSGETTFTIDLGALKDGENEVEVRLYDRTGKLVGKDQTKISTDQSDQGPVTLTVPKVGQTVMGPVSIKVGFGREFRNAYVSFFVNDQFKSMTNYPPFEYTWDTTTEPNGWHEVQAWLVDETSNTFKTRKVRVFVNNPGGRTNRVGVTPPAGTPMGNPIRTGVEGAASGLRSIPVGGTSAAAGVRAGQNVAPVISGSMVGNPPRPAQVGAPANLKPTAVPGALMTGARNMTPTGTRTAVIPTTNVQVTPPAGLKAAPLTGPISAGPLARAPKLPAVASTVKPTTVPALPKPVTTRAVTPAVKAATSTTGMVAIAQGQRFPNLTSLTITWGTTAIPFDVAPRVDNGVPMSPFRHLIEHQGGKVDWENFTKSVRARSESRSIFLQIGDANALINDQPLKLEIAPYLDRGRTIVPLSFIREALNVNVEVDPKTGHVLITRKG